jgi:serine/threonine protein kinase
MIGDVLRIRYEIVSELSKGPIFTAYQAKDRLQGREVTLRLINEPFNREPAFIEAIRSTVARYSSQQSLGLETMIEVDDHDGMPFIISEFTKGQSLQERIEKLAPFSVSVAISTVISICDALSPLHHQGIAHGDINAQNVLVLPDGQCRLQLAGMWESYSGSQTAGIVALPSMAPYLAPEVSAGALPSPTSDVYAVGILLYQLLSGRYPFSADTPVAMALKQATAGIPSVKIFNSAVPNALDDIVKKSMAKDPGDRYHDASELLSDLRMLQDGLRFGKPVTPPSQKKAEPTKQPVAPKMSAIRDAKPQKKAREPRDVPVWLMVSVAFFAAVVLALLGVWVVFNMSQPKLVVVPNIKGSKVAEATRTLDAMKLKLRISGRDANDRVPPDTIIDVLPPPGRKLHEGSTVNVRISTGSRFVDLPDLTGVTVDKARAMLEAIGVGVEDAIATEPNSSVGNGLIVSQDPSPKSKVERNSKVRLTVSGGRASSSQGEVAGEEKQYLYTLKIRMAGIEKAVVLRVEITDTHGTRSVYEQLHQPDDIIEIPAQGYGKEAKFGIYYDGELVKEIQKKAEEEAPTTP